MCIFLSIISKESDVDVGGRVGGINVFRYIVYVCTVYCSVHV